MTGGPILAIDQYGRRYLNPFTGDKYPSVTTILNQAAKPALKNWAAKMVATYAVEQRDAWKDLPTADAIDLLKREPLRYTQGRMDIGSAVHAAIELRMQKPGDEPPMVEPEVLPYIAAATQFLDDHVAEILRIEVTCFNETYRYAGTADLFIVLKDGRIAVADWKTGKAMYEEVAWQLTAYARAEFLVHGTGTDGDRFVKLPVPQCDIGIGVHLKPDATYQARTIPLTERRWKEFTALRTLQKWNDEHKQEVFGPDLEVAE